MRKSVGTSNATASCTLNCSFDRVFEAAERLVDHPLSGRVVPEFEDPTLREIILGSYRIVHRVRQDTISVVTVFHTARLLKPEHIREAP